MSKNSVAEDVLAVVLKMRRAKGGNLWGPVFNRLHTRFPAQHSGNVRERTCECVSALNRVFVDYLSTLANHDRFRTLRVLRRRDFVIGSVSRKVLISVSYI